MNRRYQKIRKQIARKNRKRPLVFRLLLLSFLLFLLPAGGYLASRTLAASQEISPKESIQSPQREESSQKTSNVLSSQSSEESADNTMDRDRITESSYSVVSSSEYAQEGTLPPVSFRIPTETEGILFIGDSRTEGLALYSNLPQTTFYAHKGLTVKSIITESFIKEGQDTVTVLEALERHRYSKIFIMLGINELGWSYSSVFSEQYEKLVDQIQKLQPKANVYIQSILPVSKEKSDSDPYINNERIESYNELLKQIAKKQGISYLPVNEKIMDSYGCLPAKASVDGVHLNQEYCLKWLAAIEPELSD